jgi:tetratricopeptide (TPR) repeat protein
VNYSPKNKEMYMLRGGYYTELKDYEKAVADFKKIMELDTMETGFNYDIALCYEAAGKEKEAIQHYERFLANPPEYETAEVLDNARGRLKALKEKN